MSRAWEQNQDTRHQSAAWEGACWSSPGLEFWVGWGVGWGCRSLWPQSAAMGAQLWVVRGRGWCLSPGENGLGTAGAQGSLARLGRQLGVRNSGPDQTAWCAWTLCAVLPVLGPPHLRLHPGASSALSLQRTHPKDASVILPSRAEG